MANSLNVLEICAGAGGQSLGLEMAGFTHAAAIEIDQPACGTLSANRPHWNVICTDVREVRGAEFLGVDLLAGGVPCPPFSIAGKQLGANDDRDLFPWALRLARECRPAAVMLENVRGLSTPRFDDYRRQVMDQLERMGYASQWQVLKASEFGVPQLRPRSILIAVQRRFAHHFEWPYPQGPPPSVGTAIGDLMGERGWQGASRWARRADGIAPTIVGGSKKHGGPDLGPSRARAEWLRLGVDGLGIADAPPSLQHPVAHLPKLTLRMVARLQGFPDSWLFSGRKTAAYRQIGNAFPPPVAAAVGRSIYAALTGRASPSVEPERASQLQLLA